MDSVSSRLKEVQAKIEECYSKLEPVSHEIPRLVAVSKTKPVSDIIEAYQAGQRHFGEKYVQELTSKATDAEILEHCPDIRWHFIGHLQTNKANKIITTPNIYMIETVDTSKLAFTLNDGAAKQNFSTKLKVLVQVNTSQEPQKDGCKPAEGPKLAEYILENCPNLEFCGFMTIGLLEHSSDPSTPNPDFICLAKVREEFCRNRNLPLNSLELSMGMSADFEEAIKLGSTNVRVGTSIFGARNTLVK